MGTLFFGVPCVDDQRTAVLKKSQLQAEGLSGNRRQVEKCQMATGVEQINLDLRQHQQNIADWQWQPAVDDLHAWADRFLVEFKLQTTTPAVMIKRLRSGAYGHHRRGRNNLGLRNEIAISKDHLEGGEYWQVLGTLLHELLHAEQEDIGKPGRRNYHNQQFRDRAAEFGLIVDAGGRQQYAQAPTPFLDLLGKHGVNTPELPPPTESVSTEPTARVLSVSRSKRSPWICGCRPRPIHIQVAINDLRACCLKCGHLFRPKKGAVDEQ